MWFVILNFLSGIFWILVALVLRSLGSSAQISPASYYFLAGLAFLLAVLHLIGCFGGRHKAPALRIASIMLLLVVPFGTAQAIALSSYEYGRRHAGRGLLLFFMTTFTFGMFAEVGYLLVSIELPLGREYQKRTMADMRSIGTALEAYAVNNTFYPPARTVGELVPFLEPKYVKKLPFQDTWHHDFFYIASSTSYTVCSTGKDGKGCDKFKYEGPTRRFENDIVFSLGAFTVYPEGAQQ